jgi:hypothetical protein
MHISRDASNAALGQCHVTVRAMALARQLSSTRPTLCLLTRDCNLLTLLSCSWGLMLVK